MSGVTGWICTPMPAAVDRAAVLQLPTTLSAVVGRNGEGDADVAARRREDRGVDADHLAVEVEGRAAGIAAVHRRVDLDEVVVGAGADVAAAGRDDAGRDRAAEAERIADRDHPVADARLRPSAKLTNGKLPAAFDLEQREVGLGSVPIDLGVELRAVVHDDRDLGCRSRRRGCW